MKKPKLLLHICCAPCSTHVLTLLSETYDTTGYFFNPNIHPRSEYQLRIRTTERHFVERGIPLITPEYQPREWFSRIKGTEGEREGGARCAICFRMRLEETARAAAALQFDLFGTTLSISPHKDARLINQIGKEAGISFRILFYEADFKKAGGYSESCRMSKSLGLYRQNYCGCIFSKKAREIQR
ncbi:MAG: epoxyqueuosine reductase QueH [Candidatus Aureabacteria bacterium]|nr:epoxyqueuosine reductase QueH [Candidatus Auribacterota bacterium]